MSQSSRYYGELPLASELRDFYKLLLSSKISQFPYLPKECHREFFSLLKRLDIQTKPRVYSPMTEIFEANTSRDYLLNKLKQKAIEHNIDLDPEEKIKMMQIVSWLERLKPPVPSYQVTAVLTSSSMLIANLAINPFYGAIKWMESYRQAIWPYGYKSDELFAALDLLNIDPEEYQQNTKGKLELYNEYKMRASEYLKALTDKNPVEEKEVETFADHWTPPQVY